MATAVSFTGSSIGKKYVMALSGIALFGFLMIHMVGNLQIFLGQQRFNDYSASLHKLPALLWVARIGLIAAVLAHIVTSVQLVMRNAAARPKGYAKKVSVVTTYAARTMRWSGPIIFFYIVYHLLHFTLNLSHPGYEVSDLYTNVVASFKQAPISIAYLVANLCVGFHLYHGAYSLFQSLGANHPRYNDKLRTLAAALALLVTAGFVIVPVGVIAGLAR